MKVVHRSIARQSLLSTGVAIAVLTTFAPAVQVKAEAQATGGGSEDVRAEIDELKSQVKALSAEVRELKRSQASQVATSQTPSSASRVLELPGSVTVAPPPPGAPAIPPPNGRFSVNLHGMLQLDVADYDQAPAGPLTSDERRTGAALGAPGVDANHARELKSGDLFRRARVGADGRAGDDFTYRFVFDFGGSGVENAGQLYEGWIQYGGFRPLRIRAGAFRPSLGLEDQTTAGNLPFIERPGSSDVAGALAGSDTRTALQVFGFQDRWFASFAVTGRPVGVLSTGNATPTPVSYGDQLGFTGRVAVSPFEGENWGVHVGVHGSYVDHPANTTGPSALGPAAPNSQFIALTDTPELRVDGTKLINTGNIPAKHAGTVGGEFAAQYKSLFLQSEYEHIIVDRTDIPSNPTFNGWYVEGAWFLTGESRVWNPSIAAFDGPVIRHPFAPKTGNWGAWELALRYSDIDLNFDQGAPGSLAPVDAVRGGDQRIFTAGVNWYLDPLVRMVFDYERVTIDRLSPCTLASSTSCTSVWLTPIGARVGQGYNAWAVRTQLAF